MTQLLEKALIVVYELPPEDTGNNATALAVGPQM